jgi:hypothetical protein
MAKQPRRRRPGRRPRAVFVVEQLMLSNLDLCHEIMNLVTALVRISEHNGNILRDMQIEVKYLQQKIDNVFIRARERQNRYENRIAFVSEVRTSMLGINTKLERIAGALQERQVPTHAITSIENGHEETLEDPQAVYTVGPFTIDHTQKLIIYNGEEIIGSVVTFEVFNYLARRKGRWVPKSDLVDHLYVDERKGASHPEQAVGAQIHNVIRILRERGCSEYFEIRKHPARYRLLEKIPDRPE